MVAEMKARCIPAVIIALISTVPAAAQGTEDAQLFPRRLLVSIQYPSDYGLSAEEMIKASRSLLVSLAQAEGISIVEYSGEMPRTRQGWNTVAEEAGADCWLSIGFEGSADKPEITLLSYDLLMGKQRIDQTVILPDPLPQSAVSRGFWDEPVSIVSGLYFAVDADFLTQVSLRKAVITIKALPNTLVTGLPGKPIKVGKNGTVVVEVPIPATYSLQFTRQGSLPLFKEIYVDGSIEVPVYQDPGSFFAADFSLYNNFFPGVGIVFFPVRNYIFLKAGIDSFLVGLAMSGGSAFFSFPLTAVNFQAGSFFTPEESVPRISIALGAFLRIAHLSDAPFIIDALAPGGGLIALSAEMGPTPQHRFFLEYSAIMYFTEFPELIHAIVGWDEVWPGWVFTDSNAYSLFNLRFGFRWML